MTGLDLERDALIEIAAVVTDAQLKVLGEGINIVIKPPAEALANMNDFVRAMHTSSGLINELDNGVTLEEAQEQVLDYLGKYINIPGKSPLGGNTVATDKMFLERDMKELVSFMHYRMIDVSSIKELARRWYPRIYFAAPTKNGGHRALADILESIDELRYYRAAMFVDEPGPDSASARATAARTVDSSVSGTIEVPQSYRKGI